MEREGGREGVCNIPENDGFKHDLVKKIVIILTNILNAIWTAIWQACNYLSHVDAV